MGFRARHRRHRRTARLAVIAMLLQVLIPALHHPASMAMAEMLVPGGAANLCLASTGALVQPGMPDKVPVRHLPTCAICQAVHAIGGFQPPSAPALVASDFAPVDFSPPAPMSAPVRPMLSDQQPRAPPALA